MSEQDYFKDALANFTFEAASGGAIRHLADLGYTAKEIHSQLTYPTPYERVQKVVWEHMLDAGILQREEPGCGKQRKKVTYVKDYDPYGRVSFRQVVLQGEESETVALQETAFQKETDGSFQDYLEEKCALNGEEASYVSCDFGLQSRADITRTAKMLRVLEESQRDYIAGLPWENRVVYHRLDQRMRDIVIRLYEKGGYHGICYFIETQEKIKF